MVSKNNHHNVSLQGQLIKAMRFCEAIGLLVHCRTRAAHVCAVKFSRVNHLLLVDHCIAVLERTPRTLELAECGSRSAACVEAGRLYERIQTAEPEHELISKANHI
jgi:hypothetical protein